MKTAPHFFICCGERSGDEHAAHLIVELQKRFPQAKLSAVAGAASKATGIELFKDISETSGVMGFTSVFKALPKLIQHFKAVSGYIRSNPPDVCIFIDYPDFNLRLAKVAKRAGCSTLYFIPPKLWAWRKGRIKLFKRWIDRTAVIFPFEESFFRTNGYVSVSFVGHPFTSTLADTWTAESKQAARLKVNDALSLSSERKLLAIFPGSRRSEVSFHAPVICKLIGLLKQHSPGCEIVLALTSAVSQETEALFLATGAKTTRTMDSITVLQAADAAILKSGTSNLQAVYTNTPCGMFFKTGLLNQIIIRALVHLKSFSPVNIIRPDTISESLQHEVTAERLLSVALRLLTDEEERARQCEAFSEIRALLATSAGTKVSPASQVAALAGALYQKSF